MQNPPSTSEVFFKTYRYVYLAPDSTWSGIGEGGNWWGSWLVRLDNRGRSLSACFPTTWAWATGSSGAAGCRRHRKPCSPQTNDVHVCHHLKHSHRNHHHFLVGHTISFQKGKKKMFSFLVIHHYVWGHLSICKHVTLSTLAKETIISCLESFLKDRSYTFWG